MLSHPRSPVLEAQGLVSFVYPVPASSWSLSWSCPKGQGRGSGVLSGLELKLRPWALGSGK